MTKSRQIQNKSDLYKEAHKRNVKKLKLLKKIFDEDEISTIIGVLRNPPGLWEKSHQILDVHVNTLSMRNITRYPQMVPSFRQENEMPEYIAEEALIEIDIRGIVKGLDLI